MGITCFGLLLYGVLDLESHQSPHLCLSPGCNYTELLVVATAPQPEGAAVSSYNCRKVDSGTVYVFGFGTLALGFY